MIEGLSRNQLAIGAAVALLLVVVIVFLAMRGGGGDSSVRDQVLADVEAIRAHELDHKNIFGDYIAADAAPRAPHLVNGDAVAWEPTRGFERLSWEPSDPAEVRGSYSVVLEPDGFRVIGVSDADADGKVARVEATAGEAAHLVTSQDVY
ncbi:MAG: hypothetical protein ACI8PZ_002192 [Myxococcota bacterium]|jgi:hypothetical protein